MPEAIDKPALYSDLDEVLNKPPKKLVRYGNIILLLVIILTIATSFLVQHNDAVICTALIKPERSTQIKTPAFSSFVKKVFIKNDTLLHKGDTLLHLKQQVAGGIEADTFILAPFNSWVTQKRIIENGEQLPPAALLFDITGSQTNYTIDLEIAESEVSKIKLGMPVNITLQKINTNCTVAYCKVISTPFKDAVTKKNIVEARLVFTQKNTDKDGAYCYIFKSAAAASIIIGSKSLAASLTEF